MKWLKSKLTEMTYAEKLKDPRWQKKRLEILNRDNFKCSIESCGETTKTLHVHHLDYLSDTEPWDYPNEYLMTICESCHQHITEVRHIYEDRLRRAMRLKLIDSFSQCCAADYFEQCKNLSNVIFLLWELLEEQDEVENTLVQIFQDRNERTRQRIIESGQLNPEEPF